MARPRLLVNCPVCEMTRPVGGIKPHALRLRIVTHEVRSEGRARIRNALTEVDDATTREYVRARLEATLEAALDEIRTL